MSRDDNSLLPIELLAVAKALDMDTLKKDGTRDLVSPGAYEVDIQVSIQGTIKVGEDTEAVARFDPPTEIALLLLLQEHMSKDEILDKLPKAMNKAHTLNKAGKDKLLSDTGISGVISRFKEKVQAAVAKEPRKGNVTSTLFVKPL